MTDLTPDATPPTDRTRVRRRADRGRYERAVVEEIRDEGFVAHVGVVLDEAPVVIPTMYARGEGVLYLHGSPAAQWIRAAKRGAELCVTVTLLDGLVLARSAFHHSMNYRAVMVFGVAREVTDEAEKLHAMRALVDAVVPGRWPGTRGPSPTELKGTTIVALPLDEASAKVRTGMPVDDDEDYALDHWAGVIPLGVVAGAAVPDSRLAPDAVVPDHISRFARPGMEPSASQP